MSDEYISKEQFVTHFRKLLCEDCNHRKGIKNGKLTNRFVYPIGGVMCRACEIDYMLDRVEDFEPADVRPVVTCERCVYHVDCGYHYCNKWGENCPDDADFFCAYGEEENDGT